MDGIPLNTSIRVSNPVRIATELGGEKLYGDINIAIRELIQNSIDAIHVYRLITMQDNTEVGKIKITLEKSGEDYFLTITDNGIGMSQNLLTNELLDFGGSYWKTNKFYNDFKGIPLTGFESIGKYGIGFFSSFMLGKEITVTSWKYGESIRSMRTLDFYDGISSNPILRQPTEKEKNSIIDRGTSIRIKLNNDPFKDNGIIKKEKFKESSLKNLVQYYVPSVDVEISIKDLDGTISTLMPNSIEKLNYSEIIEYIETKETSDVYKELGIEVSTLESKKNLNRLPLQLIDITNNGRKLGRLLIKPRIKEDLYKFTEDHAIVLAKGIRVSTIRGFVGYINTDEVVSIKRDISVNVISYESMREWAKTQIKQIEELNLQELFKDSIKDIIISFNLFDDDFPIVRRKKNNIYSDVTIKDLKEYIKKIDKIIISSESKDLKNRLPDCDNFIIIPYGIDMEKIIIKSELDKVNSSHKLIRGILKEEWHEFEESVERHFPFFNFTNEPYEIIWNFEKSNNSNLDLKNID